MSDNPKVTSGPGSTLNPDNTSTLNIMILTGFEIGKTIGAEYVLK